MRRPAQHSAERPSTARCLTAHFKGVDEKTKQAADLHQVHRPTAEGAPIPALEHRHRLRRASQGPSKARKGLRRERVDLG